MGRCSIRGIQLCPGCFRSDDRGVGELGKKEILLDGYEFSQTFRSAGTPFLPKVVKIEAEGRLKLCFLQSRFLLSIQFLIFPFFIWNLTFEQQHNSFEEVTNYQLVTVNRYVTRRIFELISTIRKFDFEGEKDR